MPTDYEADPSDLEGGDERAARLVQAVCDPAGLRAELGDEAFAALVGEPGAARELAELDVFLRGVKAELAPGVGAEASQRAEAHSIERVTRRVLARTTREELGWRGDLRLVGEFVSDRLRASAWLRVAAALLFVQLTVVPILAWHMLSERPDRGWFRVHFEERVPDEELLPELPENLEAPVWEDETPEWPTAEEPAEDR